MITKDKLNFEMQLEYCINNAPSTSLRNKMLEFQESYNNHNQAMIVGMTIQVFLAYRAIKIYLRSNNIAEV